MIGKTVSHYRILSKPGEGGTEAAKLLGIHPTNLHRLIRTLNLKDAILNERPRS